MKNNKITIIGAGLAGSLLSVYLAKKGFEVNIYERRPDMRKSNIVAGKSINLALSTRGIHALKEVGLYDDIKKIAIPMYGRMIHSLAGELSFQRYGKDDTEYINAVSRAELNILLMNLAEKNENVKFHFNDRCSGIDFHKPQTCLYNEVTKNTTIIKSDAVIATDGATSAVRMEMQKIPRFNFSQEYENYGYKELIIPAGESGNFQMEKNALHIWPRGSFMLIALPNLDGSYTCTLFMAYDISLGGENSFEFLDSREKVIDFFNKQFSDAVSLIPTIADDYFNNPTGTLMTVKCYPWIMEDKVALLGDAAHAIVPFFGQGMNAAFEDCTYLNECIESQEKTVPENGEYNWREIFGKYQTLRKINTDAIADLAQENFIEMRDLVSDKRFLLKKKIETDLFKKFPDTFIPKYTMVTFLRIPYSVALKRGRIQNEILDELTEGNILYENVDFAKGEKLIREKLDKLF
ncbi:MAG TPA: NAD(P)/FAD-dependent oxidoreductase [Ignavibacteria bacterium]|nr:NAD(P)/FAD-dependent oxidoreductase [Ignavibacteria bacterium]